MAHYDQKRKMFFKLLIPCSLLQGYYQLPTIRAFLCALFVPALFASDWHTWSFGTPYNRQLLGFSTPSPLTNWLYRSTSWQVRNASCGMVHSPPPRRALPGEPPRSPKAFSGYPAACGRVIHYWLRPNAFAVQSFFLDIVYHIRYILHNTYHGKKYKWS